MNKTQLFLALALSSSCFAQTPKLAFEVATIKPSKTDTSSMLMLLGAETNGRFSTSNLTVRQLLLQAYGLQDFQVTGGPGWITSERFDVEAAPPPGTALNQAQTQEMLQSLLEERFQLKVRRETKPMAGYRLTTTKGGSKMKPSADQTSGPVGLPAGVVRARPARMMRTSPAILFGQGMTMTTFARMLSAQLGRPVVDNTGLTGMFDVELNWTPERTPQQGGLPPGFDLPPVDPNGPTLFTALQEQLGLRLEATTQPGEVLTIESIERPSEN